MEGCWDIERCHSVEWYYGIEITTVGKGYYCVEWYHGVERYYSIERYCGIEKYGIERCYGVERYYDIKRYHGYRRVVCHSMVSLSRKMSWC